MKTWEKIMFVLIPVTTLAVSCTMELPRYPSGNEGTTQGLGGGRMPPVFTEYPPYNAAPLSKAIPAEFMRGVDISNCYTLEQAGAQYYYADNTPGDIVDILKANGVNWVRLRLWVDHTKAYAPGPYPGDGGANLLKTKAIAKRAKAAGMKFLLDLHYSDNWADPGRQQVPDAWKDLTVDQLYDAVYEYTLDTILELKAAGAEPDMVQLGNEITGGLLRTTNGKGGNGNGTMLSSIPQYARALNAGARAARLVNPDIKLLLHYDAGGGGTGMFDSYASRTSTPLATEVDFDVCGLSWYPYYGSHGTLQALRNNIAILRTRYLYPKEVAVVEAGYAWTSAFDNDDMPNLFHTKEEELSAQSIPENSPYAAGSNIVYEHRDGTNTLYIPASPHNQAAVFRTIINAINDGGGMGIFWWAADWIAYPGLQSNWDNQAAFDFNGKALPALAVWSIKGASE